MWISTSHKHKPVLDYHDPGLSEKPTMMMDMWYMGGLTGSLSLRKDQWLNGHILLVEKKYTVYIMIVHIIGNPTNSADFG